MIIASVRDTCNVCGLSSGGRPGEERDFEDSSRTKFCGFGVDLGNYMRHDVDS